MEDAVGQELPSAATVQSALPSVILLLSLLSNRASYSFLHMSFAQAEMLGYRNESSHNGCFWLFGSCWGLSSIPVLRLLLLQGPYLF